MYGNKKGPENKGQKTGRALGYCSGNENPGFESSKTLMGMRRGNGRGPGHGMGCGFGRGARDSHRYGRALGRGQNFRVDGAESENSEIKARLDAIESLLKKINK